MDRDDLFAESRIQVSPRQGRMRAACLIWHKLSRLRISLLAEAAGIFWCFRQLPEVRTLEYERNLQIDLDRYETTSTELEYEWLETQELPSQSAQKSGLVRKSGKRNHRRWSSASWKRRPSRLSGAVTRSFNTMRTASPSRWISTISNKKSTSAGVPKASNPIAEDLRGKTILAVTAPRFLFAIFCRRTWGFVFVQACELTGVDSGESNRL